MKHCSKCQKLKDESEFSKCSKTGRQRYCKQCRSDYAKEHRQSINETAKAYYRRNRGSLKEQIKRVLFRRTKEYESMMDMAFCSECGSVDDLCLHFIDGNIDNKKLDNLKVICRVCLSKSKGY